MNERQFDSWKMNVISRILAILTAFIFAPRLIAEDDFGWGANATQPVPVGAKVTLEVDKNEYFIGENVLVHFILENTSDKPFDVSFGGDYRGSSRSLRFKVTATDDKGRVAEDPDPSPMNFGGLGGSRTLKPGEKFTQSLPLMRYRDIDHAGRYTIHATHDFGWKEGERKRPGGEATILFRAPNPIEAEQVVANMEKLPDSPNSTWGQKARDYADFTCLRAPVYLDPLLRRVRAGNQRALDAIGRIATPDATAALIKLATDPEAKLGTEAARILNQRLPDPEPQGKSPRGAWGWPHTTELRQRFATRAWDTNFAPPVRALAINLLARNAPREVGTGAFMLQAVGSVADAPVVVEAMDRALNPMVSPRRGPKDNILDFPEPLPELIRTMDLFHSHGFALQEGALSGSAQILLYFHWLAGTNTLRSSRWPELLDAFGSGSHYPINEAVVRSIPSPAPAVCVPYLKSRLEDRDLGVCRAACQVAGESDRKEFIEPLLHIVATENHEWLIRQAIDSAQQLHAGFDLLVVCADRLADEALYNIVLTPLQKVIEGLGDSHSGRTDLTRVERLELRKQWTQFLTAHEKELRAGKQFKIRDAAVTAALFGRARTWQLPDGTFWPMSWADQAKIPSH